jgi:hypothetical protein
MERTNEAKVKESIDTESLIEFGTLEIPGVWIVVYEEIDWFTQKKSKWKTRLMKTSLAIKVIWIVKWLREDTVTPPEKKPKPRKQTTVLVDLVLAASQVIVNQAFQSNRFTVILDKKTGKKIWTVPVTVSF